MWKGLIWEKKLIIKHLHSYYYNFVMEDLFEVKTRATQKGLIIWLRVNHLICILYYKTFSGPCFGLKNYVMMIFFIIDWSRHMLKWNFSCFGHSRFFSRLAWALFPSVYIPFVKNTRETAIFFWCSFWWAFYVKFGVLIIQLLTRLAWFCSTATVNF